MLFNTLGGNDDRAELPDASNRGHVSKNSSAEVNEPARD
jgi:hypothetical protein